jgi:DNA-binding GntR family transcriptional regulator
MQFKQEARISGRPRKRVLRRPAHDTLDVEPTIAPSRHDLITAELRDLIVEGDLAPGARLVEADVCRRLGTSRTPLREALKVLAGEGLIELQPNRGALVARMTPVEALDMFEVIAELEALAAARCCQTLMPDGLVGLNALHLEMCGCYRAGNKHDYFVLNDRIHRSVVVLAGNQVLAETHSRLLARARRARYRALLSIGRWDQSMDEHQALMAALHERRAADAARIWRAHVLATGELVARQIAGEELGAEACA